MNAALRIVEFRRAVSRLNEALAEGEANPLSVDASIQRFEFSFELAWKSLSEVLMRDHGIRAASPKSALQQAYQQQIINDEPIWLDMLRDRNLSTHTYREALAREIHSRLPRYAEALGALATRL